MSGQVGLPEPLGPVERGRLAELAGEINDLHAEAERLATSAVEHALRVGRALLDAKARCRHGEWLPWLRENVAMPERTARWYMQAAKSAVAAELVSGATIAQLAAGGRVEEPQATNLLGEPDPRMQEDGDDWRAEILAEQGVVQTHEESEPALEADPGPGPVSGETPEHEPEPERVAGEVLADPLGEARKRYSSAASRAFRDNDKLAARQALAVWRQEIKPRLERVAANGVEIDRSRWQR